MSRNEDVIVLTLHGTAEISKNMLDLISQGYSLVSHTTTCYKANELQVEMVHTLCFASPKLKNLNKEMALRA